MTLKNITFSEKFEFDNAASLKKFLDQFNKIDLEAVHFDLPDGDTLNFHFETETLSDGSEVHNILMNDFYKPSELPVNTDPDLTGYKKEFPDFVLPHDLPEDWTDVSWHNDECPSWSIPQFRSTQVIYIADDEWMKDNDMITKYCVTDTQTQLSFNTASWTDLIDHLKSEYGYETKSLREVLVDYYSAWTKLPEQSNHDHWSCAVEMRVEDGTTDNQAMWLEQFSYEWEEMEEKEIERVEAERASLKRQTSLDAFRATKQTASLSEALEIIGDCCFDANEHDHDRPSDWKQVLIYEGSFHICIQNNDKYYLILERSEYTLSGDEGLARLEELLYDWFYDEENAKGYTGEAS